VLFHLNRINDLWLNKGSVSDGESNSKGNYASNKSSSVSDDGSFVNISSVGSKRGQGSNDGGHGGAVGGEVVGGLFKGGLAHGKSGLEGRAGYVGSGGGKSHGGGGKSEKGDNLEGLHFVVI